MTDINELLEKAEASLGSGLALEEINSFSADNHFIAGIGYALLALVKMLREEEEDGLTEEEKDWEKRVGPYAKASAPMSNDE